MMLQCAKQPLCMLAYARSQCNSLVVDSLPNLHASNLMEAVLTCDALPTQLHIPAVQTLAPFGQVDTTAL